MLGDLCYESQRSLWVECKDGISKVVRAGGTLYLQTQCHDPNNTCATELACTDLSACTKDFVLFTGLALRTRL